jgi:large subunit ribosomal protein L10
LPSEKILDQKKEYVAQLAQRIKGSIAGVLVEYKGINVADDTALRNELRKAGVQYTVVKNTLLSLAAADAGITGLDSVLTQTTALATSPDDYIAAARILCKVGEKNKAIKVKAGFMDGKFVDAAQVEALAKLPSREILLSTVLCAFNAPIASFARAIKAVAEQKEAA